MLNRLGWQYAHGFEVSSSGRPGGFPVCTFKDEGADFSVEIVD